MISPIATVVLPAFIPDRIASNVQLAPTATIPAMSMVLMPEECIYMFSTSQLNSAELLTPPMMLATNGLSFVH